MKNIISKISVLLIGMLLVMSCDEDRVKPVVDLSGADFVTPALTNPASGSGTLSFETANDVFETFTWSEAEYGQNISNTYTLEIGNESFASTVTLSTTEALSASVTVNAVNNAALLLGYLPFEEGTVYFRIISTVNGQTVESTKLTSAVIARTVSPFVTDFPSIYMIGAALKGWDTSLAVELYGTGPSEYSVVAEFKNGETFRFFEAADWGATSYNFPYFDGGSVDANFENAQDGDSNLRFLGATGYYRINVNLNTKTITTESLPSQPTLFMVGAAVPEAGWGWSSPVNMTWVRDGVFEATTELLNDSGASFRFFTKFDDWGSGQNYPHYVANEYDIDPTFKDAEDGDNNFSFIGTTGTYKITVNDIEKTIVVAEVGTAGPPKYLVGAGVPAAGWGWASPIELVQVELGVFEATTEFANDAFRVFDNFDDWGSGTNYPGFTGDGYSIDSNFEDALDGDNNFRFVGTPGTYKFILDTNNKTITLE